MSQKRDDRKVIFRRINGRLVPISVSAGGAAVAADAARTKRIYDKKGITLDLKRGAIQPFFEKSKVPFGDRIVMRKEGKFVGHSMFYKPFKGEPGERSFSWLSVKRKFRGKGYSKLLTAESARQMKRDGGTFLFNQVVHKNSLQTNFKRGRDRLWRQRGNYLYGMTKDEAIRNINFYRTKRGLITSDAFRETSLKGVRTKIGIKPFRTFGNKARIAVGALVALGGLAYAVNMKDRK